MNRLEIDGAALAQHHAGRFRVVLYAELRAKATEVAAKILADRARYPRGIVLAPILMGGGLPGRLVADALLHTGLVNDITPCRIRRYEGVGKAGQAEYTIRLPRDKVKGQVVIGLDDLVDGGETALAFYEHAKAQGARQVEVAVIFVKPQTTTTPRYFAEAGVSQWLVLPGEELSFMQELSLNEDEVTGLAVAQQREYFEALGFSSATVAQWYNSLT